MAGLGYPKGNIPKELVAKAKVDVSYVDDCTGLIEVYVILS